MRRMIAALGMVAAVFAGSACTPNLDIDWTLRRDATMPRAGQLTLSGIKACSGGTTSNSEPIDVFMTIEGHGSAEAYGVTKCSTTPATWTHTFAVPTSLPRGTHRITMQACTDPGDPAPNEDCQNVAESVTVR